MGDKNIVIRTTKNPNYPFKEIVERDYVLEFLEPGDQVRTGFEKGTLKKATFELTDGHIIIYEEVPYG